MVNKIVYILDPGNLPELKNRKSAVKKNNKIFAVSILLLLIIFAVFGYLYIKTATPSDNKQVDVAQASKQNPTPVDVSSKTPEPQKQAEVKPNIVNKNTQVGAAAAPDNKPVVIAQAPRQTPPSATSSASTKILNGPEPSKMPVINKEAPSVKDKPVMPQTYSDNKQAAVTANETKPLPPEAASAANVKVEVPLNNDFGNIVQANSAAPVTATSFPDKIKKTEILNTPTAIENPVVKDKPEDAGAANLKAETSPNINSGTSAQAQPTASTITIIPIPDNKNKPEVLNKPVVIEKTVANEKPEVAGAANLKAETSPNINTGNIAQAQPTASTITIIPIPDNKNKPEVLNKPAVIEKTVVNEKPEVIKQKMTSDDDSIKIAQLTSVTTSHSQSTINIDNVNENKPNTKSNDPKISEIETSSSLTQANNKTNSNNSNKAAYVIYFDFDSYKIKANFEEEIKNIVITNDQVILLVGHTDNIGDNSYNNWLSKKRAESIKNFLTEKYKINCQFKLVGKGSSEPIDNNNTIEGQAKNRRVEVFIYEP